MKNVLLYGMFYLLSTRSTELQTSWHQPFVVYLPHHDGVFEPIHFPFDLLLFFTNRAHNAKENISATSLTEPQWCGSQFLYVFSARMWLTKRKRFEIHLRLRYIYFQTRFVRTAETSRNGTTPCFSLIVFVIHNCKFYQHFLQFTKSSLCSQFHQHKFHSLICFYLHNEKFKGSLGIPPPEWEWKSKK